MKATIAIKAESLDALMAALEQIADRATMQIVSGASVSTSLGIESEDADDLAEALSAVAGALGRCDGIESTVKAPMAAWDGRRLDATPMERMIAAADESPEKLRGERALFEDD